MQANISELLAARGINIADGVRLMRHTSRKYPEMPKYLGTRGLELYQSVQDYAYKEGSHMVGFYGHRPGHALLLGIWRVEGDIDAGLAKDRGMLDGTFETLESFGRYYNIVTELNVMDDLVFHLEISWVGGEKSWNRNLKVGQNYAVERLDECPLDQRTLSSIAVERIAAAKRLHKVK